MKIKMGRGGGGWRGLQMGKKLLPCVASEAQTRISKAGLSPPPPTAFRAAALAAGAPASDGICTNVHYAPTRSSPHRSRFSLQTVREALGVDPGWGVRREGGGLPHLPQQNPESDSSLIDPRLEFWFTLPFL